MQKTEFLESLVKEGYEASFLRGIPTISVEPMTDMEKEAKKIRNLAKVNGYDQSFGIIYQKKESA